jgi:hypothetical protein
VARRELSSWEAVVSTKHRREKDKQEHDEETYQERLLIFDSRQQD